MKPQHISHNQIKRTIKSFTSRVLINENLNGKCFTICYPLWLFLESMNIDTYILVGKFDSVDHFILKINGEDGFFIDPTIRQFRSNESKIFFGKRREYETFVPTAIIEHYNRWLTPLLNNGVAFSQFDPNRRIPDFLSYIRITLRAAYMLADESDLFALTKRNEHLFYHGKKYFEGVKGIIDFFLNSNVSSTDIHEKENLYALLTKVKLKLDELAIVK